MFKRFFNKLTGNDTDIPVEKIAAFAEEHFAVRVDANEESDVPCHNFNFSVHFLEIKTGKKISSAKVILTFVDNKNGVYIPLIMQIGDEEHPLHKLDPLFGKQPNRLLAQKISGNVISFSNHYHFADGYWHDVQLAQIFDYEVYQRFHTLLVKLCMDCELSSSKMTHEMLVDLKNLVKDNDKIEVRELLAKLLENDHSQSWVFGDLFV